MPNEYDKRYDLVESFDALALAGRPSREQSSSTTPGQYRDAVHYPMFVGGMVRPGEIRNNTNQRIHNPQTRPPPRFPLPFDNNESTRQSLTMQHALRSPLGRNPYDNGGLLIPPPPVIPSRPYSLPPPPPPQQREQQQPRRPDINSADQVTPAVPPSPPPAAASKPTEPVTPPPKKQVRSASSPATPSTSAGPVSAAGTVRCSGVTKQNKRCTRRIKLAPALRTMDEDIDGDGVERFCHQHSKEVLTQSGFYSRKNGKWVNFEDYIPKYLQQETQLALRTEMEKAASASDVDGYIYTFEIRDPSNKDVIQLKVGRAVNVVARTDQWSKQCTSKEQVLRGFWPGSVAEDGGTLMKGRVIAGEKGPYCHRLERLIHIELGDLAANTPYLVPKWPNVEPPDHTTAGDGSPKKGVNGSERGYVPCEDCGKKHKEIFYFARPKKGKLKEKEWDSLVRPVIEKWGEFVRTHLV